METYYGQVRTPVDAIKLFEACRLGLLPRVQRRLSEKERQAIRSGSVFVWDEREAGMRRWTDGKSWSASRVSGSFLTYREMEGKRGNAFGGGGRRGAGKTPDSGRGSDEDQDDGEPDGYRYKPDGLMKQSFSITTSSGQHLHLIAYYSRGNVNLPQPSTDASLRQITPVKGMYPESSLNETPVPALTRGPMQSGYPPHHHPAHHQPHPQQPMHPGYPPQYSHMGYGWPPSPVGTPPYSHGHYPYPQGPPHPQAPPHSHGPPHPPSHAYSPHPHQPYPPAAPPHQAYERAPLPLPHPQQHPHQLPHPQQLPSLQPPKTSMPLPQPYPQTQHHPSQLSPPRPPHLDSPRSQHLQAQAREAVQIDPRLGQRGPQPSGPLPAPNIRPHQQQSNGAPRPPPLITTTTATSPPPTLRSLSASPPRSAGGPLMPMTMPMPTPTNKNLSLSVSALLHPTPSTANGSNSSEPSSAHSVRSVQSSGSPPLSSVGVQSQSQSQGQGQGQQGQQGLAGAAVEDARVVGVLNKRFCG